MVVTGEASLLRDTVITSEILKTDGLVRRALDQRLKSTHSSTENHSLRREKALVSKAPICLQIPNRLTPCLDHRLG